MSIKNILQVCQTFKHDRDIGSVFVHLKGEISELNDEIYAVLNGKSPNDDGVIGEAVDCILCLVDIIYHEDNSVSVKEINNIVNKKLTKWKSIYGEVDKTQVEKDCDSINQGNKFYSQDNF